VNKLQEKIKLWVVSHIKNADQLTDLDNKAIDFLIVGVPEFVGVIVAFAIMTFIYTFLYKKYGFERTIIYLLITIIFVIGETRKAVRQLGTG
jgi:hypothetical protein